MFEMLSRETVIHSKLKTTPSRYTCIKRAPRAFKRVKEYAKGGGKHSIVLKFLCINSLPKTNSKFSDECCVKMKEDPLKSGETRTATLSNSRTPGGRRGAEIASLCLSFKGENLKARVQPFAPVSDEFEEYLIEKYDIPICRLYHAPFNFDRTGCKGCPFALHLAGRIRHPAEVLPE